MRHALLHDAAATLADLDEQLRREEGAARFDAHALEGLSAEELAGTIRVTHGEPEEEPQAGSVDPRIGQPDGGVGTADAEAGHDVSRRSRGPSLRKTCHERGQVGETELAVAIGEADEGEAGRAQSRADGRAIAAVHRVVDHAHHVGVLGRQSVCDPGRAIPAAVIDAEDLEASSHAGQLDQRLGHESLDVLGL